MSAALVCIFRADTNGVPTATFAVITQQNSTPVKAGDSIQVTKVYCCIGAAKYDQKRLTQGEIDASAVNRENHDEIRVVLTLTTDNDAHNQVLLGALDYLCPQADSHVKLDGIVSPYGIVTEPWEPPCQRLTQGCGKLPTN